VFAKKVFKNIQQRLATLSVLIVCGLTALPAQAATNADMPWEAPLQTIMDSITGPVAQIIAVLAIAITGLALAFGDSTGGFRKLIQIVFGLSIAFAAATLVSNFFGFGGGAVITAPMLYA